MSISAVVLTKNEEKNIDACLKGLDWCDELIVVDDHSTDKTVELAKKHKAIVYEHALENDFSKQRNFGLEKAKNEWVLFVDADETVSENLRNEIIQYTNNPINQCNGFYVKRIDYMWGKQLKYGEQGNIKLLRLAKKEAGKWSGKVHEVWNIAGSTSLLENPLQHFPHPSLAEFLKEINFYSTLRAQELHAKGVTAPWFSVLLYTKGKFFQDYIVKFGFLDGIEGFIAALIMSFYSFLVRGKLWQLTSK